MPVVYRGKETEIDRVDPTWDENRLEVAEAEENVKYVYDQLSLGFLVHS
jgi:hypothetical protein